eukprot:365643-Chlamydomonas_euryale.AAC.6
MSRVGIPAGIHMLITHPQREGGDAGEVYTDIHTDQTAHWTHPPHNGLPPRREVEREEALAQ